MLSTQSCCTCCYGCRSDKQCLLNVTTRQHACMRSLRVPHAMDITRNRTRTSVPTHIGQYARMVVWTGVTSIDTVTPPCRCRCHKCAPVRLDVSGYFSRVVAFHDLTAGLRGSVGLGGAAAAFRVCSGAGASRSLYLMLGMRTSGFDRRVELKGEPRDPRPVPVASSSGIGA
jgi:hypothetical protein